MAVWFPSAGVTECHAASGGNVLTPDVPIFLAGVRPVIAVDEHEVDRASFPCAAHVLATCDVPVDARPAVCRATPNDESRRERRRAPSTGKRPPTLIDERVDQMKFGARREGGAEHQRRRALVDTDLYDTWRLRSQPRKQCRLGSTVRLTRWDQTAGQGNSSQSPVVAHPIRNAGTNHLRKRHDGRHDSEARRSQWRVAVGGGLWRPRRGCNPASRTV